MGSSIEAVLGEGGIFETKLPYFKPRPQQLDLAQAIADCILDKDILIAEAGTGTGKTFAYLIPALLSGKKTIKKIEKYAQKDKESGDYKIAIYSKNDGNTARKQI